MKTLKAGEKVFYIALEPSVTLEPGMQCGWVYDSEGEAEADFARQCQLLHEANIKLCKEYDEPVDYENDPDLDKPSQLQIFCGYVSEVA